jgi:hypothetical protein
LSFDEDLDKYFRENFDFMVALEEDMGSKTLEERTEKRKLVWAKATPEQWAAIVEGQKMVHHQLVLHEVRVTVGRYEYVICSVKKNGADSYIRNTKYKTCRAVMLAPKPAVWKE